MPSKAKVFIASSGLVLSLTAGAGMASAQDLSPLDQHNLLIPAGDRGAHCAKPRGREPVDRLPTNVSIVQQFLVADPVSRQQMSRGSKLSRR